VTTPGSEVRIADRTPPSIEPILQLVAPRLRLVEEELRKEFDSQIRTIREVGDHILDGGGKRLRPILVLLVSQMLGYRGPKDVTYATVVEFIHTATLIHDDIIDEAALRRGKTSVNFRWGNHLTVLIGDYLYLRAMNMGLAEGDLDILRILSDATIRMTEGEILGLEYNARADLTLEQYFDVAERKTAALFAASCRIPALLAGAPAGEGDQLAEYGRNLGICFQIVDDLLDVTASEDVLGKPTLSDLKEGKITLPLILALPKASAAERRAVEEIVTGKSFGRHLPSEIAAIASRHGTIAETLEIARDYGERARTAIRMFDPSPARDALEQAIDFVLQRSY
jgi:octaprenyl-diphosphate synthase